MPEAEPILKQEQMHTPGHEEHVHSHAEVHDHFTATAEHGSPGQVCTPECNHTQQEADQFADNLFSEAETRHAAHGEKGHVCDASCKHTQAEADTFADSLFKDNADHNHSHEKINHGEKGHVCTAECKHTQAEADSFADKLFDTAKEQAAHGEKGHVCDASCKHTQEQADHFADELFAEKSEQSQAAKDYVKAEAQVHEQAAKVNKVEEGGDQTKLHMQAQEALRAQREALMADALNRNTTDSEVKVQPEPTPEDHAKHSEPQATHASKTQGSTEHASAVSDQSSEKSTSETDDKRTEFVERAFEAERAERQIAEAEASEDNSSDIDQVTEAVFEDNDHTLHDVEIGGLDEIHTLPSDESEAGIDAAHTDDEARSFSPDINSDETDLRDTEDLLADFDPNAVIEDQALEIGDQVPLVEASELDAIEGDIFDFDEDTELVLSQNGEVVLLVINNAEEFDTNTIEAAEKPTKSPETLEEVLASVPELEPIKELVPAIAEFVTDTPEKAKLVQEIEPILDTLIKLLPDSESRNEISVEISEQLLEQLELLSLKLGISTDDLLKSLEIDPENIEQFQLLYEILYGLKKWLSLEYSLEFTSSQSQSTTATNSARDPRTLGQIILSVLQNVKMSYAGLSSA